MEFLDGIGEFMAREGIGELEIVDGDCVLTLRRICGQGPAAGPGGARGRTVTAPLSGILHLSPAPGEPPYAPAGERKKAGDTLFRIEAMKHVNDISAEWDLVVEEVLVEEGEAVMEGQAILRVNGEDSECRT